MSEIQMMMTAILVLSLCVERASLDCPNGLIGFNSQTQPDCVKLCESRRPTDNAHGDFEIPCKDLSDDDKKICNVCQFCDPNSIFGTQCCFDLDCPKKPTPPPPPPPPPSSSNGQDRFKTIFWIIFGLTIAFTFICIIGIVICCVCGMQRRRRNQFGRPVQPFVAPGQPMRHPGNTTYAPAATGAYPTTAGYQYQPYVNASSTATHPQNTTV